MAIKRMNHAVLYVRDAEKTYGFYRDVFGFRVVMEMPGAKFLQAPDSDNDHDLGLFSIGDGAGPSQAGPAWPICGTGWPATGCSSRAWSW